jgi:ankyrin repeat protein
MCACARGHISIVQQLLARTDVDVNARGRYYGTPLIVACDKRHLKIINLLLAKDSIDINLTHGGKTPFIVAARMGLVEVLESLFRRKNFDPNIVTIFGRYALGDAAARGDVNVMKLLLRQPKVDPNFAGGSRSSLMLGALFPNVVKLLLEQQGIDVNYEKGDYLGTALMKTAAYNCVEFAKLLLERDDIKVNVLNSYCGWTALHWASKGESLEVMDLLLKRDDIDVNPTNFDGETPLALACLAQCTYPSIPIIRSLLSHRNVYDNSILANFIKCRHKMDSRYADEIESLLRNKEWTEK